MRLRETDGRTAIARLRLAAGIEAAWRSDLLEEKYGADLPVADGAGGVGTIEVTDGTAHVPLGPFETATLRVRLAEGAEAASPAVRPARRPAARLNPVRSRPDRPSRGSPSTPGTGCTGRGPRRRGTCQSRCTSPPPGSRLRVPPAEAVLTAEAALPVKTALPVKAAATWRRG